MTKRDILISAITNFLKTSVDMLTYYKKNAETRKAKFTCTRNIKKCYEAIEFVGQIKHIQILEWLATTLVGNNAIMHSVSGGIVLNDRVKYFDTNKGYPEFLQILEDTKKQNEIKNKNRVENLQAIHKAQEQGKKVQMVWDKDSKTAKPMIIEEKPNA